MVNQNWYIHQLETTANFSNNKSFFSWFIGGLNYQIEHHLFPTICHVHYHDLSKIVKKTALEYNVPYHASNTFLGALNHHYKHLKLMGKKPV
jgi:linoleoyl-CoA desaturase